MENMNSSRKEWENALTRYVQTYYTEPLHVKFEKGTAFIAHEKDYILIAVLESEGSPRKSIISLWSLDAPCKLEYFVRNGRSLRDSVDLICFNKSTGARLLNLLYKQQGPLMSLAIGEGDDE